MEEKETTKPPTANSKDEQEVTLGRALGNIRSSLIKPYLRTKDRRRTKTI